jgi:hypothetical protein
MADIFGRYKLLAQTAAGKTPRQLVGIVHRKVRNRIVPWFPIDVDCWYRRQVPDDVYCNVRPHAIDTTRLREALSSEERERYQTLSNDFVDDRLTFLNRSREIPDPAAVTPDDERLCDLPRLWYLKLAGFEPVRWGVLGYDDPAESSEFAAAVEAWLEECVRRESIASRVGYLRGFWTPYAISLRIITLCRYAGWIGELPDRLATFLYKNLLFLDQNIEWDVGGNHLLENGSALVVGGAAFPEHGYRFVARGLNVLGSAAETQFLEDGYHYERSPMYHLAVTTRVLTSLSVLRETGHDVPRWLRRVAARACAYLTYLRPPDGRIPLLNDSVLNEAERLDTVSEYARAVGINVDDGVDGSDVPDESDLYWLSGDGLRMLVDAGDSGPTKQLAHTHNDPGTVLVWRGGERLIVDTGTFDYQPGERRQTARCVGAHNTIQVGDTEPAAFGGRFHMSGAIKTTTTHVDSEEVTKLVVTYRAGSTERYTHRRTCYEGPDWLLVWDQVNVNDQTEAEATSHTSRLHAHPDVSIEGDSPFRFIHDSGPKLVVQPFDVEEMSIRTAPYFPRFGVEWDREVLSLGVQGSRSGYVLAPRDIDATLDRKEGTPTGLCVDDERYRLPPPEGQL